MANIKAIIFGVGEMGKLTTRLMVEKGVEIVGAIDIKANIGKDIGEVAGLGRNLNVKISDDVDKVLEEEADIVILCARSYMEEMGPYFKKCIEKKKNILTLAEEAFFPWRLYAEKTKELDELAKEYGVTLTAGGIQDVVWLNLLTAFSGACHKIDMILGKATSNVDFYGPAAIEAIGVGQTEEEFKGRMNDKKLDYSFFGISLEAIIARLDMKISDWKEWVEPVLGEDDTASKGLGKTIAKGLVIGWNQVTEIHTDEGVTFRSEFVSKVCKDDEPEGNKWFIKGVPDLYLDTPGFDGPNVICASIVNRIPDVINSKPGFVTLDKLPQSQYKALPLHCYVG